jgi:hypothetical protein
MTEIFRKLDSQRFAASMRDTARAGNLNVITVIQGVALGILALNIHAGFFAPALIGDWLRWAPYPLICFGCLIIVTFDYIGHIATFERAASVVDLTIIFIIGLTEIAPMFFLKDNQGYFWFFQGMFFMTAAGAWLNTLRYCNAKYFAEDMARRNYVANRRLEICVIAFMALECFLLSYFAFNASLSLVFEFIAIALLSSVGMGLAFLEQRVVLQLQRDHGLTPRW